MRLLKSNPPLELSDSGFHLRTIKRMNGKVGKSVICPEIQKERYSLESHLKSSAIMFGLNGIHMIPYLTHFTQGISNFSTRAANPDGSDFMLARTFASGLQSNHLIPIRQVMRFRNQIFGRSMEITYFLQSKKGFANCGYRRTKKASSSS